MRVVSKYAYVLFYQRRVVTSTSELRAKCNTTSSPTPVTEVKCNATSPLNAVTELKAKCYGTNQEQEEAEAIKPNDRNSTGLERSSELKEASETSNTTVLGCDTAGEAKSAAMKKRSCGNEPAKQDQYVKQCLYKSVKVSLADIDENDLD